MRPSSVQRSPNANASASSAERIFASPSGITRKIAATVIIANALEFFDYFSYATFIAFINKAYFPHSGTSAGLVYSLGIFAAGFLARPLGAVLIGGHADATGRKPALLLTSALVTAGTLGVAVVPGYSTLGLLSPMLVLLFRLIQGIAIGGEMGVSASLLIESCPTERRSLYAGWLMAGQGLALVASGICGMGIFQFLSPTQVEQWGWRLPFALASTIVPLQFYLRRHLQEDWRRRPTFFPIRGFSLGHRKQWLVAIMLIFGGTVPTYMATYTAAFGVGGAAPSARLTAVTTVAVGLTSLVMSVFGGWLADRFGNARIVALSRVMTMILVLPIFHAAALAGSGAALVLGVSLFAALSTLGGGPTIVEILRMFPERRRALSLSLVYSVGVALFGGTAPLLVATLNLWTSSRYSAAWYIVISGAVTLTALYLNAENPLAAAIRRTATRSPFKF
jgi:MFS family permease